MVLDRQGREGKQFPLPSGLATLGSDAACDIRVLLPTVSAHHATVVVHANQVCLLYQNWIVSIVFKILNKTLIQSNSIPNIVCQVH